MVPSGSRVNRSASTARRTSATVPTRATGRTIATALSRSTSRSANGTERNAARIPTVITRTASEDTSPASHAAATVG